MPAAGRQDGRPGSEAPRQDRSYRSSQPRIVGARPPTVDCPATGDPGNTLSLLRHGDVNPFRPLALPGKPQPLTRGCSPTTMAQDRRGRVPAPAAVAEAFKLLRSGTRRAIVVLYLRGVVWSCRSGPWWPLQPTAVDEPGIRGTLPSRSPVHASTVQPAHADSVVGPVRGSREPLMRRSTAATQARR